MDGGGHWVDGGCVQSCRLGVRPDALVPDDDNAAIAGMGPAVFSNTGQVCLAPERLYVERPIFERFVAAMKATDTMLSTHPKISAARGETAPVTSGRCFVRDITLSMSRSR